MSCRLPRSGVNSAMSRISEPMARGPFIPPWSIFVRSAAMLALDETYPPTHKAIKPTISG